jgi:hypothetical protein
MLLVIARRLIRSRPQNAGRPQRGHHLQRRSSGYIKLRCYRKIGDVAQGRSYICGMTAANPSDPRSPSDPWPLGDQDQGKSSLYTAGTPPLPSHLVPVRPDAHVGLAVHAA